MGNSPGEGPSNLTITDSKLTISAESGEVSNEAPLIAVDMNSDPELFNEIEARHDATSVLESGEINSEPFGGHPIRNPNTGKIEYQLTPEEYDLLKNEVNVPTASTDDSKDSSTVGDLKVEEGQKVDEKLREVSQKLKKIRLEKQANERIAASAVLLEKTAKLSNQEIFEDKGMPGFEGNTPLFSRENVSGFEKPVPLKIHVDPELLSSGKELYISAKSQMLGTDKLVPVIYKVRQSSGKAVYRPVEGNELKLLFSDISSGLKQKREGKEEVSMPEVHSLGVFKDPRNNNDPFYAFIKPEPVSFNPVVVDMTTSKEKTPEEIGKEYLKLL